VPALRPHRPESRQLSEGPMHSAPAGTVLSAKINARFVFYSHVAVGSPGLNSVKIQKTPEAHNKPARRF